MDAFNQGREWILTLARNERDGHLVCFMEKTGAPASAPAGKPAWPGPYEAQCLTEAMCALSRTLGVDWEIHDYYGVRPVGSIRAGECQSDAAALADAARNMMAVRERDARN